MLGSLIASDDRVSLAKAAKLAEVECRARGARSLAAVLSSADTSREEGGLLIRLIDDVRLIPPTAEDMAECVEDLEIPLDPGMTVDDPDDVEVVWLVVLLNGFESSPSGRLIAGTSLCILSLEISLAVSDLGSPRPRPELSLSEVSVTDMRRRWDGLRGGPHGDGGTDREVLEEPDTLLVDGVRYPREGSRGR